MRKNNENVQAASTVAKAAGFKTLKEVAELTNLTPATLHNYYNADKHRFFDALHTAARHKVDRATASHSLLSDHLKK